MPGNETGIDGESQAMSVIRFLLGVASLALFVPAWILVLAGRLLEGRRRPVVSAGSRPLPERHERRASIIILNWNGRRLLEENLPSVVEAVRSDHGEHEIIVVDNGSSDDSVSFVRGNFPEVKLVSLPENMGFSKGNNHGVELAGHPFVVLLNNDMRVEPDFLRPLLEGFDEDTFAVSSQVDFLDPARPREETGKTAAFLRRGWFSFAHQPPQEWDEQRGYVPIFYAGGGSSAFHREKYLALGGLRELYSPCYVEDTDLSFRAWKRGWKVLFAPRSRVHHEHRASSARRFAARDLEVLILRNQLLFAWVNLHDWKNLLWHGLVFPACWMRILLGRGSECAPALAQALRLLPQVLLLRRQEPAPARREREIFRELEERYRFYYDPSKKSPGEGMPLRILMVTAYLPHLGHHAGAGRMFHLIRRMARRHKVSVLTFAESPAELERAEPLREFCASVRVLRRDPDYIRSLFIYEPFDAFYSTPFRRALLEELEKESFDLIHYEYAQMAAYILDGCPIPQILTEHEVNYAACRLQARIRPNWLQKVFWFYNYMQVMHREIRLMSRPDAVICMTPKDAGFFAGLMDSRRLEVIPTGVDLEHFDPACCPMAEEPHRLVFVGSFNHHPNCEAMLFFCREVFPLVEKEFPEVRLSIVGSSPPGEISALARSGKITVTGYVEDLRPHLLRASVYVVPLRLGVGIRGKILEAWAMQRPVLATRLACAGLPAVHGENVWLADTPAEMAAGIGVLFRDEELRRHLGAAGRRVAVEKYSWEAAAGRLESLYRKMIQARR